jgi:tetratricopeptide (TPR) repeat protein
MFNKPVVPLLCLSIGLVASSVSAQTPPPPSSQPPAPGLIKLTGDDAKKAESLDKSIEAAQEADRWDEAITMQQELLALRTRVQGPKHFETVNAEWRLKTLRQVARMPKEDRDTCRSAQTMQEQAEALDAQGKYAQAQPLYEKVLEIYRRLLTDDHPATAESYEKLAVNLMYQRKSAAAQPRLEKALEIRRRLFTDDHPATATSYDNTAANLNDQGKYAAAQPLHEKALEIYRRLLGDDHPATAGSYNNLAYNLKSQGKYAQAQPLYEKALEIKRRLLSDDHRDTALGYNNLAINLAAQGKYAQAQPLFQKGLEIKRRLLGDDHPDTAISYNSLAGNLDDQGKHAQAQPLFEKALEIRRRRLSDDHPATAVSYNNLAGNLNAQGKHAAAQPLFERSLEIRRRLLTDDHPDTARAYNNLAWNLKSQGKYAQAQPLHEKALEIRRLLLTDDHPQTAISYNNVAANLNDQGKYAQAQPLHEKSLEIYRRLLSDDHPQTAISFGNVATNLNAQGKYLEARDRWLSAAKSLDAARLRIAFTGLERARTRESPRPALAAVQARLGQPAEAWQTLEEDLGRGLLDELAARKDQRLAPAQQERLRALTAELERLDRLAETTPKGLDQAGRARRFEDLKHRRELASIALGEFQAQLVQDYGTLAGPVAGLDEIQAALPADAALVTWVDIPPSGPSAADPDGEHWGVVVRSRGTPAWVPIAGTGPDRLWNKDDTGLAERVGADLRARPAAGAAVTRPLLDKLRTQRLGPLAKALGAMAEGLPAARRLIVLPSRAMAGIPVEALLAPEDTRTVSYAPSATVFRYLRDQPRPDRHAGLLALGDPVYEHPDKSSEPQPPPDHGLLVNVVTPGSNAATHGLRPGDVLLSYNGVTLQRREDLKAVPEPGRPVPVEVWREGRVDRQELAAGKLGVVLDPRPAPQAIAERRRIQQVLVAARSGDEDLAPLPGTRYEVEALAGVFRAGDRPTRILLGTAASEPELDRLATAGELARYGYIHLATHGVIDQEVPARSAVILTQTDLPDPLAQVLNHQPAFDGRLTVREIQGGWDLKADLVTLSACETARGRYAGGEGFVGFAQALLMSGARSVCLSLWKVDDTATALLMQRFYANLLGARPGISGPMPKAEALTEAKSWLRGLRGEEVATLAAKLAGGEARAAGAARRKPAVRVLGAPAGAADDWPYAHPYYWAAFVLMGDPD